MYQVPDASRLLKALHISCSVSTMTVSMSYSQPYISRVAFPVLSLVIVAIQVEKAKTMPPLPSTASNEGAPDAAALNDVESQVTNPIDDDVGPLTAAEMAAAKHIMDGDLDDEYVGEYTETYVSVFTVLKIVSRDIGTARHSCVVSEVCVLASPNLGT